MCIYIYIYIVIVHYAHIYVYTMLRSTLPRKPCGTSGDLGAAQAVVEARGS